MTAAPASILISSIRLIGDVILTTPLIGVLRDAYPDAAIDVLVGAGTGGFLERDPRVRNVLTVTSKQLQTGQRRDSSLRVLGRIFRRYDLAITMNASDRGALAVICAGRKQRVGFYEESGFLKNAWKKLFLNAPLFYDTSGHVVLHCRQIAEALGIEVKRLEARVYWNEGDRVAVADYLRSGGAQNGYFVMHPFARWEYKYWDLDSFVRLNDLIAESYGITPVWTSSPDPDECSKLEQYASRCRFRPVLVRGVFSLNRVACLISGAALYIGLDTAVTHIAASTGVPMLALYGPTPAYRWFPWNNSGPLDQLQGCPRGRHRNGAIVMHQKTCAHPDCIRPDCHNPCMPRIGVDEVYADAVILLEERGFPRCSSTAGSGGDNG